MANDPHAIKQAYFDFNSVSQTPWTSAVNVGVEAPAVDFQELSTGWTRRDAGLKNGSLTADVFENDDGDVTSNFWSLVGDGTAYAFEVRPSSGAVAAGNPKFTGSAHVTNFNLSIAAGEAMRQTINFGVDGAITMATS